jgi:hypothetical protein
VWCDVGVQVQALRRRATAGDAGVLSAYKAAQRCDDEARAIEAFVSRLTS